ncbi:MAG: L-2-amino-thiazoline-4-carboxylic acid hydrolase [Oscillospiraceae bacterium]|nr:L-2-amino-thiazoline-4-carboxylic acid hydrolase [Oscillospiraceae bacterium]
MKKKYDPEKMIAKSRFKDFYNELKKEEQLRLTALMTRLIKENSEYADSKNYGHLCNLITSLAIVLMLEENGRSRKEAEDIVAAAMYKFIEPQIDVMQKLASNSWFVGFLKISMPIKFRNTLGYGWNVEFPECPKDTFSMITHSCIYHQIFSKYGMPEMTAVFCKVDDILYSNLPRAEFLYTEQIGRGGRMCDYTFKKR